MKKTNQLYYCRASEKCIRKLEKELTHSRNNDTLYLLVDAMDWLKKYCSYRILFNKDISVYLLKDNCKINRRKIHIRPVDEEKYSTQYEDSQIVWSELWKGDAVL